MAHKRDSKMGPGGIQQRVPMEGFILCTDPTNPTLLKGLTISVSRCCFYRSVPTRYGRASAL